MPRSKIYLSVDHVFIFPSLKKVLKSFRMGCLYYFTRYFFQTEKAIHTSTAFYNKLKKILKVSNKTQ